MLARQALLTVLREDGRGLHHLPRWVLRWAWWLTGVATLLLLSWLNPAWLGRLDLLAYDLLLPNPPVWLESPLIIAIDDASLQELGRWPWPRARHADMLERLDKAGASAIGLAVLFGEPDASDPAGDAALAAAVTRSRRVVLPVAPEPLASGRMASAPAGWLLGQTKAPLGHVDIEIDMDGQARRLYLQAGYARADVPALALAVRQIADPNWRTTDMPGVRANPPKASPVKQWMRDYEVLLPRLQGLPTLSFSSVLHQPDQLALVRDRAVFIGVTATGLGGELVTPLGGARATVPAVVLHGHAYAALAQHTLMQRAPAWLSLLVSLVLLTALALWPRPQGRQSLWLLSHLGLPVLVSLMALHWLGLWLGPAQGVLILASALLVMAAAGLQRTRQQLHRSRQHLAATLQAIGDAVITLDARSGTIRYANPTALAQADRDQLIGLSLRQAYPLSIDSHDRIELAVAESMQQLRRVNLPTNLTLQPRQHSDTRFLSGSASPLIGPQGQLDGTVLVLSDQTAAVTAARQLDYAATHDELTGLPNRAMLHQRLGLALTRSQRHGGNTAILFLDLNRFKVINDSLGHRAGDEVLKVVAKRLRQTCRETDLVARWGGDEFVLVLEDMIDHEGAARAAAKVIEVLTQEVELSGTFGNLRLPSTGSVGVVVAPQDGVDMDDLLAKADMAMYRAKAQPQACFQFWSEDLNTSLRASLALELDLRKGLNEHQLVLYYQPQFSLAGRELVGMEALMRWQRTPESLLMPGEFIPVAESSGLIIEMGAWAVLQAARQLAAWLAVGLKPAPIAVNVSARQCLNRDIVDVVRLALQETRIPPALLRLEITESIAMSNVDQVIELLQAIRALGVGLALDDFGTGFSSLSYIKRFPIDEIKIDRSFVIDIASNREDLAIVRATIALAHGLNMKVVAEGIETEAQGQILISERCDVGQGYLYGFPQPINQVTRLVR